jgi:hypothetical protein
MNGISFSIICVTVTNYLRLVTYKQRSLLGIWFWWLDGPKCMVPASWSGPPGCITTWQRSRKGPASYRRGYTHVAASFYNRQQFVRMKLTTLLQKGLCDHLDSCVQQGNNFRKIGNSESIAYQNTKGDFQRWKWVISEREVENNHDIHWEQVFIALWGIWDVKSFPKTNLQGVIDMKFVKELEHVSRITLCTQLPMTT